MNLILIFAHDCFHLNFIFCLHFARKKNLCARFGDFTYISSRNTKINRIYIRIVPRKRRAMDTMMDPIVYTRSMDVFPLVTENRSLNNHIQNYTLSYFTENPIYVIVCEMNSYKHVIIQLTP